MLADGGSKSIFDPIIAARWGLKTLPMGSGCGSVGKAVASNTRGPQFVSSHRQKFIFILNICLQSTVH